MTDVIHILGADGWSHAGAQVDRSAFESKTNGVLEADAPGGGGRYIFHETDVFEDQLGVVRRLGRDRKYVEWVSGPLVGAEDPDEWSYYTPADIIPDPDLRRKVAELKARGLFVKAGVTQPYKTAWEVRGMENLLCDYMLNPAFVEKLYDKIYAFETAKATVAAEAGVDMLGIGGDIAMQDRVIMGPENWRRIDKPRLARLIRAVRRIKSDIHIYIHSDGDLTEIMDDLIEIGFNVIDPIQPECMDPVEVKQRWGDRITLHGCGGLQKTLPFGSVDDVRNEVIHLIEKCGYNGGLILRVSNAIGFDCPLENVLAFFETARDYSLSDAATDS